MRVAGELFELRRRRREGRPGHLHAADALDDRDLRERLRALVPIERQGERLAGALVVPRLLLVVHSDQEHAVPRALLHRDLRAERLHDTVALGGRESPELGVGPLGADRRHLGVGILDDQRAIAVQVRLTLVPVVRILLSGPVRTLHVLHEDEGAAAHDMRLVPVHVLRENVGLVDPVEGRRQRGDERGRGPFEAEDNGRRIGRLDRLDGRVLPLAERHHVRGRVDDLVIRRLHVLRREVAAVVEFHAATKLEGVRPAVLGDRPGFGEIADHFRTRSIGRVEPEQGAVDRGERMDQRERSLTVPVVGGGLRRNDVHELAAVARTLLGVRAAAGKQDQHHAGDAGDETSHHRRMGAGGIHRSITPLARRCRAAGSGNGSG